MTYSDQEVIRYIEQNFVPWRVEVLEQKDLVERFRMEWTPCVVTLDSQVEEHHRFVGFLSVQEFMAQLSLGRARIAFHDKDFSQAADLFDGVVKNFPYTSAAPEAIWYRGVSRYQASGDPAGLKATRVELEENHPHSIWGEKASAWGA